MCQEVFKAFVSYQNKIVFRIIFSLKSRINYIKLTMLAPSYELKLIYLGFGIVRVQTAAYNTKVKLWKIWKGRCETIRRETYDNR